MQAAEKYSHKKQKNKKYTPTVKNQLLKTFVVVAASIDVSWILCVSFDFFSWSAANLSLTVDWSLCYFILCVIRLQFKVVVVCFFFCFILIRLKAKIQTLKYLRVYRSTNKYHKHTFNFRFRCKWILIVCSFFCSWDLNNNSHDRIVWSYSFFFLLYFMQLLSTFSRSGFQTTTINCF